MFWNRPTVSDDMRAWIEDCFDWFDDRFLAPPDPILPTKAFFSAGKGEDVATARQVVADIKRHLHLTQPIDVIPLDTISPDHRHDYQSLSAVAGTFQWNEDGGVIRYDPANMRNPLAFINLMAHEVMHARLSGLEHQVPGGAGAHELATDLGCIIAGFGIFQLQAADDLGWSGYMTQPSRAFALATFLDRRGLGVEAVESHLSRRCLKLVRKAFKDL